MNDDTKESIDEPLPARRDVPYLIHDLVARITAIERKVDAMHEQVRLNTYRIDSGLTGGAEKLIAEIKAEIKAVQRELGLLETKTTRWEGGGVVIYAVITLAGGFIGWFLSRVAGQH